MHKLIGQATQKLAEIGIIKSEEEDLISYGLEVGLAMLINILTTIAIGIMFSLTVESIIFLTAYIPIRSYAGGYHASTYIRCYAISVLSLIAALAVISFLNPASTLQFILTCSLFSIPTILFLAPVANMNKPLDKKEFSRYKKIVKIILFFEILAIVLCVVIKLRTMSAVIAVSLCLLSIMLIIGTLVNNRILKTASNRDNSVEKIKP